MLNQLKKNCKYWYLAPVFSFIILVIFPYTEKFGLGISYAMMFFSYISIYHGEKLFPRPNDKTKWTQYDYFAKGNIILGAIAYILVEFTGVTFSTIIYPISSFFLSLNFFNIEQVTYNLPWSSIIIFFIYILISFLSEFIILASFIKYIKELLQKCDEKEREHSSTGANGNIIV